MMKPRGARPFAYPDPPSARHPSLPSMALPYRNLKLTQSPLAPGFCCHIPFVYPLSPSPLLHPHSASYHPSSLRKLCAPPPTLRRHEDLAYLHLLPPPHLPFTCGSPRQSCFPSSPVIHSHCTRTHRASPSLLSIARDNTCTQSLLRLVGPAEAGCGSGATYGSACRTHQ
jgi:hypothetical protein